MGNQGAAPGAADSNFDKTLIVNDVTFVAVVMPKNDIYMKHISSFCTNDTFFCNAILEFSDFDDNTEFGMSLSMSQFRFIVRQKRDMLSGAGTVPANQWSHLAATRNGTSGEQTFNT